MPRRPTTPEEVRDLIAEIAIEFDRHRMKAREERALRNGDPNEETCTSLVTVKVDAGPPLGFVDDSVPCWKGRSSLGDYHHTHLRRDGWCEPCIERQGHHRAMQAAAAKRGAALRRLTHWRRVYDRMTDDTPPDFTIPMPKGSQRGADTSAG